MRQPVCKIRLGLGTSVLVGCSDGGEDGRPAELGGTALDNRQQPVLGHVGDEPAKGLGVPRGLPIRLFPGYRPSLAQYQGASIRKVVFYFIAGEPPAPKRSGTLIDFDLGIRVFLGP